MLRRRARTRTPSGSPPRRISTATTSADGSGATSSRWAIRTAVLRRARSCVGPAGSCGCFVGGAFVLPYVAVVMANARKPRGGPDTSTRPGPDVQRKSLQPGQSPTVTYRTCSTLLDLQNAVVQESMTSRARSPPSGLDSRVPDDSPRGRPALLCPDGAVADGARDADLLGQGMPGRRASGTCSGTTPSCTRPTGARPGWPATSTGKSLADFLAARQFLRDVQPHTGG